MAFVRRHILAFLKQTQFTRRDLSAKIGGPVEWLDDAVTHADVRAAFVDPCTSLPYPEKELHRFLAKNTISEKENIKDGARRKTKASAKLDFSHIPIEKQVVVLFPGQGAQHIGMGEKIKDCPKVIDIYNEASEILQYDLLKLCLEGPKSKLDQTIYCQPAVFVTSVAAWEKAKLENETLSSHTTDVAGFSIGEFAAFVLSGILSFQDAVQLVKVRADAMHQSSMKLPSGMITVRVNAASRLEEALDDAKEHCWEKGELPICEIANYLFCGVKVVGASETSMQFLENNQEKYRFQIVKKLAVNGAFHTSLMKDAALTLKNALKDIKINQQPQVNVYSNYTGKLHVYNERHIREAMTKQVYSPVKWEQIQQLLHAKHQNYAFPTFMEIGPGKQLGAMLLKISKKAYKNYVSYSV